MRLEIDIAEHHYNNIMALDSVSLGRVPYKGIIMYSINAIKHGKVLDQESTTKNDLGVDCICRDSAIKALDYDIKSFDFKPGVSEHMDDIAKLLNTIYEIQVNNIKAMPSVTPQEPRKGHWIEVTNGRGGHECDVCHDYAPSFQSGNEYLSAFCPNCGADMRTSED